MAVGGLDAGAHAAQGLGDPFHRPPRERLVARQLERASLAREDAADQTHERAGVGAVDRAAGRPETVQAPPEDAQRVDVVLVDVDTEGAHRGHRGLGVGGAAEARDPRLAVAERRDQDGAVRDRLVPGDTQVPDEPRDRLPTTLSGAPCKTRSELTGATEPPCNTVLQGSRGLRAAQTTHSSITGATTTP